MPRKLFWADDRDSHNGLFDAIDNAPHSMLAAEGPKALSITGTRAPNILNGGSSADTIAGGEGGDTINGGGGNDILYGFGPQDKTAGVGQIDATLVSSGFDSPVFALSAPGDDNRLFVVEKGGQIKILNLATGNVLNTPFLDIPDGQMTSDGERGLLGMAFHPDYASNGRYYVFVTNSDGDLQVREYTRDTANVSNTTAKTIITIEHSSESNHNGGWIEFGPDGNLYIATGDGGGGGDPNNNAQNLNSLLGKILRIDVDGDDFADPDVNYAIPNDNPFEGATAGADEIFAYGLRNPWRNSFDSATGDLILADVGQNEWEEINFVSAGDLSGLNFGWHVKEGTHDYDTDTSGNPSPNDPSLIDPIFQYGHNALGGYAVTGGYVLHSPDLGAQGLYVFADFSTNNLWTLRAGENGAVDVVRRNGQIAVDGGSFDSIASFAVDGSGRLYTIGLDGEIHRLTFRAGAGDAADRLNGGAGNDSIYGGLGRDRLDGGSGDDKLNGGVDVDTLLGGLGVDTLRGLDGADKLDGGLGRDTLRGGASGDDFIFSTKLGISNVDTISDFGAGDEIQLARSVFGLARGDLQDAAFHVGSSAGDASDRIIYNASTGALFFDPDGTGGQNQVRFATLTNAPTLDAGDFVVI